MDDIHTIQLDELQNEFRNTVLPVTIVIGVEIVLGLIGNSVVLYGYTFRYPRCAYRSLILCLAVVDVLSCCTTMPAEVYTELYWFKFYSLQICKAKTFFNIFMLSLEILLLFTIAVDRYKQTCVAHAPQICQKTVLYLFIGSIVISAALAVPASVGFGNHRYNYTYNHHSVSVVICGVSDEFSHGPFNLIYSMVLQVTACLSLGGMFAVNVVILKSIHGSGSRTVEDADCPSERNYLIGDNTNRHNNANRSLQMFIVSMVFIITSLTCRVTGFIVNSGLESFSIKNTVVVIFFYRLYCVNHVIHPFIYGFLDPKFRETMGNLCCFSQ